MATTDAATPRAEPLRMVIVQRINRSVPENIEESQIRWSFLPKDQLRWWMTSEGLPPTADAYAYIRESPNSPWGVRVEILGEGR